MADMMPLAPSSGTVLPVSSIRRVGVPLVGVAGELFEDCLIALIETLDAAGHPAWLDDLRQHLAIWRNDRDVEAHRSIYGGMGSFSDTWYAGGDRWLDASADALATLCGAVAATTAGGPDRMVHASPPMRGDVRTFSCPVCGSRTVPEDDVRLAAASAWASWWVPTSLMRHQPSDVVAGATGAVDSRRDNYDADARARLDPDWLLVAGVSRPSSCERCGGDLGPPISAALY